MKTGGEGGMTSPHVMSKRWALLGAGSLLAYVVTSALILALHHGPSRLAVLDVIIVVAPLAVALICGLACMKARSLHMRWFWGLIASGHLFAALAEATRAWYEVGPGGEIPYPSFADLYWILFYPLVFGGLMMLIFAPGRKRLLGIASALDGLLFAGAAGGLGWELLIRPAMDPAAGFLENVTNVAYPAGDLLLLAGLASLAVGPMRRRAPRGTYWLATAFLVTFMADIIYAQMAAAGTYALGSWIDPLWPLGYVLVGVGALAHLSGARKELVVESEVQAVISGHKATPGEVLRRFMPYVAVASIGFLAYYHFLAKGGGSPGEDAVIIAICIALPTLVLLRQLVVVVENRRLQASLARLSSELEGRVLERTGELAAEKEHLAVLNQHLGALNETAAVMSHCSTSSEVLTQGVRLACEATKSDAAAISMHSADGRTRLIGGHNLSRPGRAQLLKAAGSSPLVERVLSDGTPARLEGQLELRKSTDGSTKGVFDVVKVIPLISRGSVLGALYLANKRAGHRPSDEGLALAQGIASQMGVALENTRRYEEAHYLAERDAVTGLLNHRAINKRLEHEVARSQRAGSSFALVTMDLDNFKLFNDTYGHVMGDEVLAAVSRVLEESVRQGDIVGRYGGDEFTAILVDTDSQGALHTIERIRNNLADYHLNVNGGKPVPVCMSYGVATYPTDGRRQSELLVVADTNLYRSKRKGGDCVTSADAEEHTPEGSGGVFTVLDGLVTTVDNKDHYTRKHSDDVTERAIAVASELNLSSETQRSLRIAGLLHDVGKIGIPDRVLRKPGPLTEEEYDAIKQHVGLGELIIKEIPNLHEVLAAVGSHHERHDGKGYPRGLKGEEIPLLGRILAVTDAYSAMTTDRPYRKALTLAQAKAELRRVAGTQLDPKIVEVFLSTMEQSDRTYETAEGASALSVA